MTRTQLIAKVARQTGLHAAQVETVLDNVVDDIAAALQAGEKVTIAGFGRFEMRERKSKGFTNPKTKEKTQLPPILTPGWKASGLFKQRVQHFGGRIAS